MSLQSIENWCLYYAITNIKDIEMLKKYRCLNKLNENIKKQEELYKVKTDENTLNV